MKIENNNQFNPSFLTVVWLVFTVIAVGTFLAKIDAGPLGYLSWAICIGGPVLAILSKILNELS